MIPSRPSFSPALTLCGSYKGYSGYDCTVRSIAYELLKAGVKLQLSDIANWSPAKLLAEQQDHSLKRFEAPLPTKVAVHFCMPHQLALLPGKHNLNFTMFEANRIPASWLPHNQTHDLVILPTESSRQAWINRGFPDNRLRLCPLGVDSDRFQPGVEPLDLVDKQGRGVADYRIRILNVSDIVPRKNLLSLLRVWLEATDKDDDAILILKLNHTPNSLLKFLRDFKLLEHNIGKQREQAASVLIIDPVLSDDEMPRLYASASHYWSMSCGEGWDQPMTEAGASGLGLIAPDHTAYRTYLDETRAILIPSKQVLVPDSIDADFKPFFAGADWWQPDEKATAATIRSILDGKPQRNTSTREFLRTHFGWDKTAERLLTIVDECL